MPAVLVAGHTTTHNSPFLPQRWPKPSPVLTAPTHAGTARLSGRKYRGGRAYTSRSWSPPSTNWDRYNFTFIDVTKPATYYNNYPFIVHLSHVQHTATTTQ